MPPECISMSNPMREIGNGCEIYLHLEWERGNPEKNPEKHSVAKHNDFQVFSADSFILTTIEGTTYSFTPYRLII